MWPSSHFGLPLISYSSHIRCSSLDFQSFGPQPMENFYSQTLIASGNVKQKSQISKQKGVEVSSFANVKSESKGENEKKDRRKMIIDINTKMFTVVELINLYGEVNQQLIEQGQMRLGRKFIEATENLIEIKKHLLQLQITFNGKQIDLDRFRNVWNYYSKELLDDDQQEKALQQKLPTISDNETNMMILESIADIVSVFSMNMSATERKRCSCMCRVQSLFGFMEQNMMLLSKNFDGKHFMINGYKGAKIDCMFFPCTSETHQSISIDNPGGEYINKPTFIICNPNALIYQQMVNSPNSYWLTFFLKRGINVMCWNYRKYGLSKSTICTGINPYNSKLDAEKVMDFLLNKMKVRGQIGVYGRSIGGIASTHLANKFPEQVKSLIVDRTFNELDVLSQRRVSGGCTSAVFKMISYSWQALNDYNFANAPCYKILTCDPQDDVVDNYCSLATGVAQKLCQNNYKDNKWKLFFQCLCAIYDMEDHLYNKLNDQEKSSLRFRIVSQMDETVSSVRQSTRNMSINDIEEENHTNDDNLQESLLKHNDDDLERQNFDRTGDKVESIMSPNENLQEKISITYIQKRLYTTKSFHDIHYNMHLIVLMLSDFTAGTVSLRDCLNNTKERSIEEFQIFLQVLEVYGVGYEDDIIQEKIIDRSQITHSQQAVFQLQEILQCYQRCSSALIKKDSKSYGGNKILKQHLINFLQFQIDCINDLVAIQNKIQYYQKYQTDYDILKQGHLVYMKCGHRGKPSRLEEKRISRLLRKSGFIPMLEEVYKEDKQKVTVRIQKSPSQLTQLQYINHSQDSQERKINSLKEKRSNLEDLNLKIDDLNRNNTQNDITGINEDENAMSFDKSQKDISIGGVGANGYKVGMNMNLIGISPGNGLANHHMNFINRIQREGSGEHGFSEKSRDGQTSSYQLSDEDRGSGNINNQTKDQNYRDMLAISSSDEGTNGIINNLAKFD
ncbi:UNKNOWN [Stylonychia lemnae]|uniref:Serine aminopeptidase S33 domain-containing protein n=1 Tax=Stylonychia lemnae TaxID=5949 RepID=A0A078AK57_STYLE|nr:UNKNOWN [Stylonychia lemnae]|eukprot:CDW82564.1 UNKNOWN [Stylonychia lemnae]